MRYLGFLSRTLKKQITNNIIHIIIYACTYFNLNLFLQKFHRYWINRMQLNVKILLLIKIIKRKNTFNFSQKWYETKSVLTAFILFHLKQFSAWMLKLSRFRILGVLVRIHSHFQLRQHHFLVDISSFIRWNTLCTLFVLITYNIMTAVK